MNFYLSYYGEISTRGHTKTKFELRRSFLKQLKELDEHFKLDGVPAKWGFAPEKLRLVGDFAFLPLVTRESKQVIDLRITLLSNCEPACPKNYPTGDIDNLLKTLIDGLRMPQNQNEIRNEHPEEGEKPFHCLLEDDQVVREVHIVHGKLLFSKPKSKGHENEIFALIDVKVKDKYDY